MKRSGDVYLDASVLVALLLTDALTSRADEFLRTRAPVLIVSDFAAAEFSSAVGRRVRIGHLSAQEARTAFSTFDTWSQAAATSVETTTADVWAAQNYLRRLDLGLRTGDALHIAIARRIGAPLATFDQKMAAGARAVGVPVVAA